MSTATLQQRSPAWHAARKGKLTASNIGAALGLCPWTSRNQAFQRAMGLERFLGKQLRECLEPRQLSPLIRALLGAGNDATRWGTTHEADGILCYSQHTGNLVEETGLHIHKDHSWLAGSPDGLVGTEGLIEVKCPYWRKKDGSILHKEIPAYYYMQMNLCLEVLQRKWCDFISWSQDQYVIYRVYRDTDLHEAMMPHYLKFFAAMQRQAKVPPPLSPEHKEQIVSLVSASMNNKIDYKFWTLASLTDIPPSPSYDSEEEIPAKRAKLSHDEVEDGA